MRRQLPLAQQPVGGFSGAGESAGKNLRVRNDQPFLPGHCVPAKVKPHLQIARVDVGLKWPRRVVSVTGVHAVDAEHAIDAVEGRRIEQDLPDRAATGAPAAKRDLAEVHVTRRFCCGDQREKSRWIFEERDVRSRTGAGLHAYNCHLVLLAGRQFGQPVSSVEEEKQCGRPVGSQALRYKERAQRQGIVLARRRNLGEARMSTRVLHHRRGILSCGWRRLRCSRLCRGRSLPEQFRRRNCERETETRTTRDDA